MFTHDRHEKELIIFKTLNGLITVNVTKSVKGKVELSINAPKDVKIYRENLTVSG